MTDGRTLLRKRKASRRARASSHKGSTFERDVCKRLSLWLSRGMHDDWFWRTAMSGGRATLRHAAGKRNQQQVGDICSIAAQGERLTSRFVIECKNYKNLHWESFLRNDTPAAGTICGFWNTCKADAYSMGRRPLMFVKQGRLGEFAIMDTDGAAAMGFYDARYWAVFHKRDAAVITLEDFLLHAARPVNAQG